MSIKQFFPRMKPIFVAGVVLLVVASISLVYFSFNPDNITATIQKSDCDNRFFEWCKGHPKGGVDYDNFAAENRDCIDRGSYRTCP